MSLSSQLAGGPGDCNTVRAFQFRVQSGGRQSCCPQISINDVECNGAGSRVRKISLVSQIQNDTPFPLGIGSLVELQSLEVRSAPLSGSIPESIGKLAKLEQLALSQNRLAGVMPSSVGDLKSLKSLDLSSNYISGSVPSTLNKLTSLQLLNLGYNQLQGTMPDNLGELRALRVLNFTENSSLSGSIPESLKNLASLEILDLSGCALEGDVPDIFGDMKSLKSLKLSGNRLTGRVPVLPNVPGECTIAGGMRDSNSFSCLEGEASQHVGKCYDSLKASGITTVCATRSIQTGKSANRGSGSGADTSMVAMMSAAGVVVAVLVAAVAFIVYRRRRLAMERDVEASRRWPAGPAAVAPRKG